MPREFTRLTAVLLGLGTPLGALADGAHTERTDVVEVIGTYDNGVGTSDAASQGSITPKLLESRPLLRPADVLEAVPGLVVTQHSGDGKATQFFLRGFNLDHGTDFATSVSGTPVNMPTHAHGQGYSDLNFLIPELVSRIDYRKGPYFADQGDFASAGAAHFHYYDRMKENLAEAGAGTFGHRRLLFAGSPGEAGNRLLYALEAVGNDGPWDSPNDYRKLNGVMRLQLGNQERQHRITLMSYSGRWNATDQVPSRALSNGLPRFGSVDPTAGGNTARTSLSYDYRHDHRSRQFQLNAYLLRYRMQLFSNFTYALNNPANGDQFEQADQRTVTGISPTWLWTSRIGERDSITKAGMHLRQDAIGKVGLYNTVRRAQTGTVREDRVSQTGLGAFVENTFSWTPWLRTIAGARVDGYRAVVDSNNAANSGNARDHLVSPKAGLVLGPWSETEFFVNYGRGFHSNDARGATISVNPSTLAAAQRVQPLVRTTGGELGARTEFFEGVQSSLALWRLSLDSELLFAGDAGTTSAGRPSLRQGIEWSNRWRANRWLLVDFDVALSRAKFTDGDPAGERIPGAVDRVVSLGAAVEDYGPWSGGVHLRHFGPRPLVASGAVLSGSSTLVNLRIGYRMERGTRLSLDVFNLFDRRASDIEYFYQSQLRGEAAAVSDIHLHPAEPRGVRLALRTSF